MLNIGRNWWIGLGLLVFVWMAWFFSDILAYLVVGAVLSMLGRPLVVLLQKLKIRGKRLPNAVAAVGALVLMLSLFTGIFGVFIPPMVAQLSQLKSLDVEAISTGLQEPIAMIDGWIKTYHLTEGDITIEQYLRETVIDLASSVQISALFNGFLGFTGNVFIGLFSILFITFFFLKEPTLFPEMILIPTPEASRPKVKRALKESQILLTRYLIGIVAEVFLVGSLITLGLWMLGVESAPLIGFLAGLFNVIPYLGPLIGAGIGIILTALGSLDMEFYDQMVPLLAKTGGVFIVVQLIDNFVFQPMIYGTSVKAHPLEIFLVILIAGNLAGIPGMILAIPSYTILRVLAREFLFHFEVVRHLTKTM